MTGVDLVRRNLEVAVRPFVGVVVVVHRFRRSC